MNQNNLKNEIKAKKLDAVYSSSPQTRLWYTTLNTTAGHLFIEENEANLIIDGRYIEYARKNAKNANVSLLNAENWKGFISNKQEKYKNIGFEEDYLLVQELNNLKALFPNATFIPISGQKLRIIKSKEEYENIKRACDIALQAYEKIKPLIKDGVSEKELDAELEKQIRTLGADKSSFDAIIASGVRSALPHGRASDKIIRNGELITIDFGAIYKGFCSDITRTTHVGKVTDPKLLEIEKILRESQKLGIAAVKPGISTFEIDKICRDYIEQHGYGEYFVHSTGHGLGIDVHELPNVTKNTSFVTILEEGMVITVEPGIYIEGIGGIRVEDDILVTKNGHQVLSNFDSQNEAI